MSKTWEAGICNETSGFLFKHSCTLLATSHCQRCLKPICDEHTRRDGERVLCPACAKLEGAGAVSGDASRDDDYPDYYGGSYYPGYGRYGHGSWGYTHIHTSGRHDPNDLTEADAESLHHEADEDFETDMGES